MQAMILAAGLGTRLRPYTLLRPKPLFPVLNRPLLLILLDMLRGAGFSRVVVNGHHLAGQIEEALPNRENLFYQFEPEILGTGGSLRQALPLLADAPVMIMNGDIFHSIDLAAMYNYHIRSGNRITMAMHDFPRFNTVATSEGRVRTFLPDPGSCNEQRLAFTGIHIVDPSVISLIPKQNFFHIIDLYEDLVKQGEKIVCFRVDGSFWQDIGSREDYLELHGKLLSGTLRQSLPVSLPAGPWHFDERASSGESVRLSGWGCVGNAVIGNNVRLSNCVVWDDVHLPDGVELENMVVTPQIHF